VSEQAVPIHYKELVLQGNYRLDLLVNDCVILELKSVEQVLPVHQAQLLSYLRVTNKPLGLLMNFNVQALKDGLNGLGAVSFRGVPGDEVVGRVSQQQVAIAVPKHSTSVR
jgi:hypothetical protein